MEMGEYQDRAMQTAIYPGRGTFQGLVYLALKLNGEAGEVAEKIGKTMRDNGGLLTENVALGLRKELGDVLWYLAALAEELGIGFDLDTVAQVNLDKLADRYVRGTLGGSGDDR